MNGHDVADLVVLAAYASLVVELTVFPIPSEASTWQLLASGGTDQGAAGPGDPLRQARGKSTAAKLLRFLLPTALGVALWLLPLACVLLAPVWPALPGALWVHRVAWLAWPGIALVALGRSLTFASVLQLRAARRRPAAGPGWLFRRSRNPGLVGMYACYLGFCVVFGTPWLWLGLPLYVANMHGRVRMEEAHLGRRHGEAWRAYAARVPRYLGRVAARGRLG